MNTTFLFTFCLLLLSACNPLPKKGEIYLPNIKSNEDSTIVIDQNNVLEPYTLKDVLVQIQLIESYKSTANQFKQDSITDVLVKSGYEQVLKDFNTNIPTILNSLNYYKFYSPTLLDSIYRMVTQEFTQMQSQIK